MFRIVLIFAATDERQMKLVTVQASQYGAMRYCTGVIELLAEQLATLRSLPSTYINHLGRNKGNEDQRSSGCIKQNALWKHLYFRFGLLATSFLLRERAQFRFERIRGMCPLLSIAVIDNDAEVRGYMFPTAEPGKSLKVKDLLGGSFVRIDQPHLVMLLEFISPHRAQNQ